jgi:hypothetical protein
LAHELCLIELIAEAYVKVSGVEGVIILLNQHFEQGKSNRQIERDLGLGASYIVHYCKRKGIEIVPARKAVIKQS